MPPHSCPFMGKLSAHLIFSNLQIRDASQNMNKHQTHPGATAGRVIVLSKEASVVNLSEAEECLVAWQQQRL